MTNNLEKRVSKLEKQVAKMTGCKAIKRIDKHFSVGDTFELMGLKWIILDITEQGYLVRTVDMWKSSVEFGDTNNWITSSLRDTLNNEFYHKLCEEIGEDNIILFERDLTSLDGQTEYGTCMDYVSMISVDEYRKYRKLLKNPEDFSYTITPDSTKCNEDERLVVVVSPRGNFLYNDCNYDFGVRPVCIFSSCIFESEE